jgi:hypothetical protein
MRKSNAAAECNRIQPLASGVMTVVDYGAVKVQALAGEGCDLTESNAAFERC